MKKTNDNSNENLTDFTVKVLETREYTIKIKSNISLNALEEAKNVFKKGRKNGEFSPEDGKILKTDYNVRRDHGLILNS